MGVSSQPFYVDMLCGIKMIEPKCQRQQKNNDQAWDRLVVPQMLRQTQVVLQCWLLDQSSCSLLLSKTNRSLPKLHIAVLQNNFLRRESSRLEETLDSKKPIFTKWVSLKIETWIKKGTL